MTRLISLLALSLVLITAADDPFAQDRMTIYRAFLTTWEKGIKLPVLLKSKTIPIDLTDYDKKGCLKGIDLVGAPSTNTLEPKMISGLDYTLDASEVKSGISVGLSLSEIRFDRAHHYAAMRFRYVCGPLCGNGTTMVFEKVDGQWNRAKSQCGGWWS